MTRTPVVVKRNATGDENNSGDEANDNRDVRNRSGHDNDINDEKSRGHESNDANDENDRGDENNDAKNNCGDANNEATDENNSGDQGHATSDESNGGDETSETSDKSLDGERLRAHAERIKVFDESLKAEGMSNERLSETTLYPFFSGLIFGDEEEEGERKAGSQAVHYVNDIGKAGVSLVVFFVFTTFLEVRLPRDMVNRARGTLSFEVSGALPTTLQKQKDRFTPMTPPGFQGSPSLIHRMKWVGLCVQGSPCRDLSCSEAAGRFAVSCGFTFW